MDCSSRDNNGGVGYFSKLEESGWLKHVRLILKAGVLAAEKLHLEGDRALRCCVVLCGVVQSLCFVMHREDNRHIITVYIT